MIERSSVVLTILVFAMMQTGCTDRQDSTGANVVRPEDSTPVIVLHPRSTFPLIGGIRPPLDATQARMRIQHHLRAAYAARGIVTEQGFPQYQTGWWSRDGCQGGIWIADAGALRVAECMIDAQGTVTIKVESEFKWTRAETVAKARSFVQQDEESRTYLEQNGFDWALDYITLEDMKIGQYSRYWSIIHPKAVSTCASVDVFPSGKIEVVISMP